ncbi:DUF6314 family protein [Yoonia vestfoldensis]|uniref:DUF6314 family protein n=1 Tax=Yoonia vestfoldensis TaxID=245188 RepID=UPI000362CA3B|nr:DUF6314 family protein [Yoonia vestfoldensis]
MLGRDDFAGLWQVVRRIEDRHSGMRGDFVGVAELEPVGEAGLIYVENGQMRFGDTPPMQATRRYFWDFADRLVTVRFADGRNFHSFVPEGQAAGTDHPCGADHYSVVYDFTRWPHWRATWDVTGPRKDYTSVTDYVRAAG